MVYELIIITTILIACPFWITSTLDKPRKPGKFVKIVLVMLFMFGIVFAYVLSLPPPM